MSDAAPEPRPAPREERHIPIRPLPLDGATATRLRAERDQLLEALAHAAETLEAVGALLQAEHPATARLAGHQAEELRGLIARMSGEEVRE
jgi:acyl transferase domain-containing protein